MKAAKLYGARDFRIEDVPEPGELRPGEVVIRVGSVGVCGSDLHTYENGQIGDTVLEAPLILGHEFAGTVIAVGASSKSCSVREAVTTTRSSYRCCSCSPCWPDWLCAPA